MKSEDAAEKGREKSWFSNNCAAIDKLMRIP